MGEPAHGQKRRCPAVALTLDWGLRMVATAVGRRGAPGPCLACKWTIALHPSKKIAPAGAGAWGHSAMDLWPESAETDLAEDALAS